MGMRERGGGMALGGMKGGEGEGEEGEEEEMIEIILEFESGMDSQRIYINSRRSLLHSIRRAVLPTQGRGGDVFVLGDQNRIEYWQEKYDAEGNSLGWEEQTAENTCLDDGARLMIEHPPLSVLSINGEEYWINEHIVELTHDYLEALTRQPPSILRMNPWEWNINARSLVEINLDQIQPRFDDQGEIINLQVTQEESNTNVSHHPQMSTLSRIIYPSMQNERPQNFLYINTINRI